MAVIAACFYMVVSVINLEFKRSVREVVQSYKRAIVFGGSQMFIPLKVVVFNYRLEFAMKV